MKWVQLSAFALLAVIPAPHPAPAIERLFELFAKQKRVAKARCGSERSSTAVGAKKK